MTISACLAELDKDDRGLTFGGGAEGSFLSFAELSSRTADLAARWAGLGVHKGDRVVLVVTDERDFVLATLSAMRAGVIPVPAFPPFTLSQREVYAEGLRRICEISGARLCLASAIVLPFLESAGLPCPVSVFSALPAAIPGKVTPPQPDDPVFIQFTSGSTGDPKGVVVTNRALVGHSLALGAVLEIDGAVDRGVSWLPLYHDMGFIGKLFVSLLTQTSTWYISPLRFLRNPIGFLRLISEVRGTISFAPNFAYGLLARRAETDDLTGLDLAPWRIAGCGAEPVRPETLQRFADAFAPVGFSAAALVPCYGMAEATLAISCAPVGTGMRTITVDADRLASEKVVVPGAGRPLVLASSGVPLPGTEIRVLDAAGGALGDGHEGELVVRSEHLADGYFDDAERTAQTWCDGWLHTGDTGFQLDGELYVTGRTKDLVIVNGRNYQPQDIERVAEQVAGVRLNNVVAFAARRGDSEAVRVVLEATSYPPESDLAARVSSIIQQRFAVPVDDVVVVRKGTLPKTTSGKLRRRHTAELFAAGHLAVARTGDRG